MVDRSTRILVALDASNFEYTCIFAAENRWKRSDPDGSSFLKDRWHTDQSNLPDILNVASYRRMINLVVQEKLDDLVGYLRREHQEQIDAASGIDFIFAADSKLSDNFRRKLYPGYKAQRDAERKSYDVRKVKDYIQDVVFKELDIERSKGYRLVKVDGCESDDIIATAMESYPEYMLRVIFSSDRDFLQLKDVVQYNCWGDRIERKVKNVSDETLSRRDYLLWKIIRGDASDNIKGVFRKYGDVKSYRLVVGTDGSELRRMLHESNDAAERFKLNMSLIDFRQIPKDMKDRIRKVLDETLSKESEISADGMFTLEGCMEL